jgi:hypothetical protein
MIKYLSPLKWPAHIPSTPLTKQQNDSGFSTNMTLDDALRFLDDELTAAGINQATLYTEIEQITAERLRKRLSSRSGVSLQLKLFDREYTITCDKWQRIEHNIYALHLTLRNFNNMEKWGLGSLNKLIAGFGTNRASDWDKSKSSVEQPARRADDMPDCLKEFGLGSTATLDDATAIYHRRAKSLPDDAESLVELNLIMDEIRAYFSSKKPE